MSKRHLRDHEELLIRFRKHELVLLPVIFEAFVLSYVPWYLGLKYDFVFSSEISKWGYGIWTALVIAYTLRKSALWLFSSYLVTSTRIIHIEHTGFFQKTVTEIPLDRLQSVNFRTNGFLSFLFRFGDVLVQVVGIDEPLALRGIPRPRKTKDYIWQVRESYRVHNMN